MLSNGSNVSGVVLRGIDPKTDIKVTNLGKSLIQGKLQNLDKPVAASDGTNPALPGVVIGKELAKKISICIWVIPSIWCRHWGPSPRSG
jgi:lipoprotein-releasing system permease protein